MNIMDMFKKFGLGQLNEHLATIEIKQQLRSYLVDILYTRMDESTAINNRNIELFRLTFLLNLYKTQNQ